MGSNPYQAWVRPKNNYKTQEKDGYRETLICIYSHVGTHIDPPAHVYETGLTLDLLPLTQFIGQAIVIDSRLWQLILAFSI